MVAILTRAELDQMVVTARANPRSIHLALESTREIACLDMATATECGYALPRGRDETTGKQNVITGPSVRLAEIVACQWGNCQAASRVTDVNRAEGWVEAEGVFIDFQTNYRVTARTRRSIRGKPYQWQGGRGVRRRHDQRHLQRGRGDRLPQRGLQGGAETDLEQRL
jgi:hypothetical protein